MFGRSRHRNPVTLDKGVIRHRNCEHYFLELVLVLAFLQTGGTFDLLCEPAKFGH
jgi:hypothetical protein